MPAALEPRMTPDQIREMAALYARVGCLLEAQARSAAVVTDMREMLDTARARAEKAEARVAELEALIAAGGTP